MVLKRIRVDYFLAVGLICLTSSMFAQFGPQWGGGGWRGGRGGRQEQRPSRDSLPTWDVAPDFQQDVFTFARVVFDAYGPFGWHDRWDNDYPDADWNFSLRLQQLTSMQVDPEGATVRLTDSKLLDYPFLYFAGVQYMVLSRDEQDDLAHASHSNAARAWAEGRLDQQVIPALAEAVLAPAGLPVARAELSRHPKVSERI